MKYEVKFEEVGITPKKGVKVVIEGDPELVDFFESWIERGMEQYNKGANKELKME